MATLQNTDAPPIAPLAKRRRQISARFWSAPLVTLRLALGLVLLLAPARALAQSPAPPAAVTLDDVGAALAKADTVVTRFVQERHLALFSEPLRSEGWLCFQRPGRLRWEITQPYRSILISDGAAVAQFEWVDERWKKLNIGLAAALLRVVEQIGQVIGGRYATGSREYEPTLTQSPDGPVITLVPRQEAMRKMMKAIEVHLAPDLKATRRVVLRETDGDFTEITFSEQVVGGTLPPGTFDRNTPVALEEIRRNATRERL